MTFDEEMEAVERFREWQQDCALNGTTATVDAYRDYLRSMHLEVQLQSVRETAWDSSLPLAERLTRITEMLGEAQR